MTGVLAWEAPPQAKPAAERAQYYGGGVPGAYEPNMDEAWRLKWKARLRGQRDGELRVEIRKSTDVQHAGSVQVKIIAYPDGSVLMSMNGTASLSEQDFLEMISAVGEARAAMRAYREQQEAREREKNAP